MPFYVDTEARRQAIRSLPAYLPGYPNCISDRTKVIQGLLSEISSSAANVRTLLNQWEDTNLCILIAFYTQGDL